MKRHGKVFAAAAVLLAATLAVPAGRAAQQATPAALKRSPPEAVAMYRDAASFQNNGAWQVAAEEWARFLKTYGDVDLAPKAQHYLGVCQMQLQRYDEAAAAFSTAIAKYASYQEREESQLNLGFCQYTLAKQGGPLAAKRYEQAAATFSDMVREFPSGQGAHTDEGFFFLGEANYRLGAKRAAAAAYQRLVTDFPRSQLRSDALYALGTTREDLDQFAEAGAAYDLFIKEFDQHELLDEVRMRKAETLLQTALAAQRAGMADAAAGMFAAAEKGFAEVAAVEGFQSVDHAVFRQALCVLKQNRPNEAAALYARIPSEFPRSPHAAEATVSAARSYYGGGQGAEAKKWFERVYEAGGDDAAEAAHWICRILLDDQQGAAAAALAKQALPQAAGSTYQANLMMDRADGLYQSPQQREEALALYLKVAAEHPQHQQAAPALYYAAFTAQQLKQYDLGLAQAEAFLAAHRGHPLTADAQYVAAECHLLNGDHARAEAIFRELTTGPTDHIARETWQVRLGLCLYLQEKYEQAVAALQSRLATIKTPANLAEAQHVLGASQFYLGRFAPASRALVAALEADPQWRQADQSLLLLSRCRYQLGEVDEAIRTVRDMIVRFADSSALDHAHYRLGEYTEAAGDDTKAVGQYDLVIQRWPKSAYAPYAYYRKGWTLLNAQQYEGAVASLTALIDGYAGHELSADALLARAIGRRKGGEPKGALADVAAYLKTNPETADKSNALYERGMAQAALGDQAAAEAAFTALLSENPKYAAADKAIYQLAWAQQLQKKHDDALANFARLATDYGDSPLAAEAHYHLGEDRYQRQQYGQAAKAYALAKRNASRDELGTKAIYKLGWTHYQLKQYDTALREFRELVEKYGQSPLAVEGRFMKAECLFRLKDYGAALPAYRQAITAIDAAGQTDHQIRVQVLLHGGQSAAQLDQWQQSLELLGGIVSDHADSAFLSEALYEIGRAHDHLGQSDEALASYERAATASRGEVGARARFMMGEIYFKQKNYDRATPQFQRVMYGFGGESAAPEVKTWQAKSAYEAARCNDVQIKGATDRQRRERLIAEAVKFYRYLVEKHPDHSLAETAKTRLAQLAQLE